ncbi:response regulator [Magnetococcales bacterium HHB-1]
MRILIADDEPNNRTLLKHHLAPHGECDLVVDGLEAVEAFTIALEDGEGYALICLDIMMPEMNGQEALKRIREIEEEHGISGDREAVILMTSALDDERQVVEAYFKGGCTDYLVKPISRDKLTEKLHEYRLIE